MPRIDPSQLLRTLSVLLAKDGGIRSAEEVPRIVQLMQKFSKKLVSKCIYIHILCSSSQELLESFLSQKGWDLLNMWFSDAIKNQNYFLCGDLVKLFAVCPMNSARLKENVEINQAPKLIRQLSCDTRIEQTVRNLALQVLQQWMSVIRTPPNLQISNAVTPNSSTNGAALHSDQTTKVVSPQNSTTKEDKGKLKGKVSPPKKPSPTKEKRRHNVIDSSESEADNVDNDDSKDYNPNDSDIENGKSAKASNPTIKGLKRNTSKEEDSTDVDDLLGGDTTSEDERHNKPKKDKNAISEAALKKKRDEREKEKEKRDKEREKEKEERRRKERERERRKAQERKDKAKPYSRTELRNSLDSTDKERIKEVAKKLKEESGATPSASLGRIPKLVKPGAEKDEKKKNGASFGDLLGEMDVKKPKPKAPPIKNKNKDLLDSINNPSPIKPKPKFDTKSADEKLKKEKERRNSFSNKSSEGEKKFKSDKIETTEIPEKNPEPTEKEKLPERPKPKIVMPEKTAEKRSFKDASPKVETKKSPSVIKESSFFGDVLGDIMKEPPRKKKRRPSDVKTEKEAKELTDRVKDLVVEKEKSPEESEDKMDTSEQGDELAFAEPTSELPREVRGILVYVKGNKAKKKIQWKPEDKLVEIEYFEMDETERANVWKIKSFEEMKKKEAELEKMKFQTGIGSNVNGDKDDEQEEAPKVWKLFLLEFDSETLEGVTKLWEAYGSQSDEKAVQQQRELRVLKSLFFNQIPCDPSEPDQGSCDKSGEEAKEIPPDDLSDNRDDSSYDYSMKDWPTPTLQSQQQVPPPISTNSINALLKDINPNLLASLPPPHLPPPDHLTHQPPPTLNSADAKLFAAQKAAAEALAATPYPTPPPGMGGSNNPHNGFSGFQANYQDRGSHRGHNNYDRGYSKGGNSNYHNNHNNHYNKNYKGRDGRDNREDHRDRGYRDNRDRQQDYKRPCKFWMERGKCKEEDRCMYPHPSR